MQSRTPRRLSLSIGLGCLLLTLAATNTAWAVDDAKGGQKESTGKSDRKVSDDKKSDKKGADGKSVGDKKTEKKTVEKWALIQVGSELRVVRADELKRVKANTDREHKSAMAEWTAAKKDAKKNKEVFDAPRPKKVAFKVLNGKLKSKEEADQLKAKAEEKLRKKTEKKDRKAEKKSKPKGEKPSGKKSKEKKPKKDDDDDGDGA